MEKKIILFVILLEPSQTASVFTVNWPNTPTHPGQCLGAPSPLHRAPCPAHTLPAAGLRIKLCFPIPSGSQQEPFTEFHSHIFNFYLEHSLDQSGQEAETYTSRPRGHSWTRKPPASLRHPLHGVPPLVKASWARTPLKGRDDTQSSLNKTHL